MHLFHHSTELVALHLAHAFLLVSSDLALFLLLISLLRFQPSDDCPCRWLFHSKKFLLQILQISPFFTLMPDIRPECIKLDTTQLFLSNNMLKLLYMISSFFQPLRYCFFFYPFNPMNSC